MKRKYKVEFVIEGTRLVDNIPLNKKYIKRTILSVLSEKRYYGNRDMDTTVSDIKIIETEM